jgi:PKD repeat protein
MNPYGDIFYYEWNPSSDNDGKTDIIIHANDSIGLLTNYIIYNFTVDNSNPVANFTRNQTSFLEGTSVFLNATISTDDSSISTYFWNFGDGTNASGATQTHTYQYNSTYTINLTVTDQFGFNNSIAKTVSVNDKTPIANFSFPSTINEDSLILFTDTTSSYDNLTNFTWSFGDTNTSTIQNANNTYIINGTYSVTLNVTDNDGSTNGITKQINVSYQNDNPIVNLTYIQMNEDAFSLTDLSNYFTDEESSFQEINWSITSSTPNLTVTINNTNKIMNITPNANFSTEYNGVFNISLTATDSEGGSNTKSVTINVTNVNAAPIIASVPNTSIIQDQTIQIDVSSFTQDIDPTYNLTYFSTFGTINETSGIWTWTPNYSNYGIYELNLTVSDQIINTTITTYIEVYSTLNLSNVSISDVTLNGQSVFEGGIVQNIHPGDSLTLNLIPTNIGTETIDDVNLSLNIPTIHSDYILLIGNFSVYSGSIQTFNFDINTLQSEGVYPASIKILGTSLWPQYERFDYHNFSINITKNVNDVIIQDLILSNSTATCIPQSTLTVNLTNKGLKNFTSNDLITLYVLSQELNLNQTLANISLEAGNYNDTIIFNINTYNITPGTYNISALISYYAGALSYSKTVLLTINNCEASFINSPIPNITINEDSYNDTIDISNYFIDYNNDTLTYGYEGGDNLTIQFLSSGILNISPLLNFDGTSKINFTVNDGINLTKSNEILVTINPINDIPVISNVQNQYLTIGTSLGYQLNATDVDAGDILSYNLSTSPNTTITINQSGYIYNFTPDSSYIDNPVTVYTTVCDAVNNCTNASFLINVLNSLRINNTVLTINSNSTQVSLNGSTYVKPSDNIILSFDIVNDVNANNISHLIVNGTLTDSNGTIISSKIYTPSGPDDGLDAGQTESASFNLGDIPANATHEKRFYMNLIAYERDTPTIYDSWNALLEVNRNTLELNILSADLAKSNVKCNRQNNVTVQVSNSGINNLDVNISLVSNALGINQVSSTKTISTTDTEEFTILFNISNSISNGTYPLTLTANSNYATTYDIAYFNLTVQNCEISFTPDVSQIVIESSENQAFSVSYPSELTNVNITWTRNNTNVGSSSSYTYSAENLQEILSYSISAEITSDEGYNSQKSWDLIVTGIPYSSAFTGTESTDFGSVSDISNVVNATLKKSSGETIKFIENTDFSNIFNLDSYVIASGNFVAINSTKYPELNKKAQITLTGLSYTNEPIIYYSDSFTNNPSLISQVCPSTRCQIISYTNYPTTTGTVVFNVTGFSSYRVTDSGTETAEGSGALKVSDVDVSEDDPKPDEVVTIDIEMENDGDYDIEDIDLTIEIRDEQGNVVEDEEDDELEDDEDFDLDEGDNEDFSFEFKMPADAKNNDEYTVYIKACGRDTQNNVECAIDTSETLTIEREKHEVILDSVVISPEKLSCYNSFDINLDIKNIGKKDEDVQVFIRNDILNINKKSDIFELEAYDHDDYDKKLSYAFSVPENLAVGSYEIQVEVKYLDYVETKRLTLEKGTCQRTITESKKTESQVVTVDESKSSTNVDTTNLPKVQTKKPQFKDTFEYLIMLSILGVMISGLIIFVIGGILIRK